MLAHPLKHPKGYRQKRLGNRIDNPIGQDSKKARKEMKSKTDQGHFGFFMRISTHGFKILLITVINWVESMGLLKWVTAPASNSALISSSESLAVKNMIGIFLSTS